MARLDGDYQIRASLARPAFSVAQIHAADQEVQVGVRVAAERDVQIRLPSVVTVGFHDLQDCCRVLDHPD